MTDPRNEARQKIANYIKRHPEMTLKVVAGKIGCSERTLVLLCKEYGCQRKPRVTADALDDEVTPVEAGAEKGGE